MHCQVSFCFFIRQDDVGVYIQVCMLAGRRLPDILQTPARTGLKGNLRPSTSRAPAVVLAALRYICIVLVNQFMKSSSGLSQTLGLIPLQVQVQQSRIKKAHCIVQPPALLCPLLEGSRECINQCVLVAVVHVVYIQ